MDTLEQKYTPEVQNQTHAKTNLSEKFTQAKETVKQWTKKGIEWFKNLRQTAEVSPNVALATIASLDTDIIHTLSEEQDSSLVEQNNPQEWLNTKNEKKCNKVINRLQKIYEKGGNAAVQDWFSKTLSQYDEEGNHISKEDLSSLSLEFYESQAVSAVAGKKILRPVLTFRDTSQLAKVAAHIGLENVDQIAGVHFRPRNGPLKDTGIIIADTTQRVKEHEMFHSIDPNLNKRVGYDCMIAELFAYYQEGKPYGDEKWNAFVDQLVSDGVYYEQFTTNSKKNNKEELSREQYQSLCKRTVDAFQQLEQKYGSVGAQRILVQQKTLDDLFNTAFGYTIKLGMPGNSNQRDN
jgi:hypothetical protein